MPHHADRPSKICPVCGRPFQWRKKWKDIWEEVRYCSERCRRRRQSQQNVPDAATAWGFSNPDLAVLPWPMEQVSLGAD